ncbi:methyl-accepting chemotaxis protein [Brevibacillus porteri]|uniref:Chemotaxis protein n=1 Tax=Brevibacillus porteri TaxID=2126350 RepID=A0ABX5FPV7_9BACL|nr:methyl-accepting chemotaxis protein [Brevibacillus porteri]MED1799443.1 methyl-accepting chemotaxis protein [Brevibacillus porteri]MED2131917.1 methyl-accepting chemotaxis protein [Brevibacillus porteri]MED2742761.1 methyl-accepting chemotaxis protein [Brevibacillus porteri]MED2817966.1 methyl-accepting chemotaxis protein [Brevibacillus porteri]MED2893206.1 methyl-accepting chemotaxis protein [Brevibacillus porteri]
MSQLLNSVLMVAPILQKAFLSECMVGVTDKEKFLAYYPAQGLNLGIRVGDELRPGSINATAVKEGKRVVKKISKELYGIPYIAVGYPLVENGRVVGCLATGVTTDQEDRLHGLAQNLTDALENIAQHTESLAKDADNLAQASHTLSDAAGQLGLKIAETTQINELIRNISTRSNVLGLNAVLEAARAGAAGRGFSVVAEEIRQLSQTTATSAKGIFQLLDEMNALVGTVTGEMEKTMNHSEQQSTRIQELDAVMQELRQMAEQLKKAAEITGRGE